MALLGDQEDSPMFGRQLSDAASEGGGDAAPKTNRKKGRDSFCGEKPEVEATRGG